MLMDQTAVFFNNEKSCISVTIRNDSILEDNERIVFSVFPSAADASVVVISPVYNMLDLTIEDDDSKSKLALCYGLKRL